MIKPLNIGGGVPMYLMTPDRVEYNKNYSEVGAIMISDIVHIESLASILSTYYSGSRLCSMHDYFVRYTNISF